MKEAIKVGLGKFGEVDQTVVDKILNLMSESYERLGPPMTNSVDLYVFEKSEEETFFVTHDASQGKPKISIYLDKILELPPQVSTSGIRRQVAHSILHGSLEFYVVKFPTDLKRVMTQYELSQNYATNILYGASMAVKEYSVTNLLYGKGFVEEQVAYVKYILEPIAGEILAWEVARINPLERIGYSVMAIRDISCAVPLTKDPKFGDEIKESIERKIDHLPQIYQSKINKITYETFPLLGNDTIENINSLTKAIAEEIIDYELKR